MQFQHNSSSALSTYHCGCDADIFSMVNLTQQGKSGNGTNTRIAALQQQIILSGLEKLVTSIGPPSCFTIVCLRKQVVDIGEIEDGRLVCGGAEVCERVAEQGREARVEQAVHARGRLTRHGQ
jgi:hypothetical protein